MAGQDSGNPRPGAAAEGSYLARLGAGRKLATLTTGNNEDRAEGDHSKIGDLGGLDRIGAKLPRADFAILRNSLPTSNRVCSIVPSSSGRGSNQELAILATLIPGVARNVPGEHPGYPDRSLRTLTGYPECSRLRLWRPEPLANRHVREPSRRELADVVRRDRQARPH